MTLKTYTSHAGQTVTLNLGDDYEILRTPAWPEMRRLHAEFRKRQWTWLLQVMTSPSEKRPEHLFALAGHPLRSPRTDNPNGVLHQPLRLAVRHIPDSTWSILNGGTDPAFTGSTARIIGSDIDSQRAFITKLFGKSYSPDAIKWLRPEYQDVYIYTWMDEAITLADTPAEFIRMVVDRSTWERRDIPKAERQSGFLRRFMPAAYLLWMGVHGIVLHPLQTQLLPGEANGIADHLWDDGFKVTWSMVSDMYSRGNQPKPERWLNRTKRCLEILRLSSTFRSNADIDNDLFDDLSKMMAAQMHAQTADKLPVLHSALRNTLEYPEKIQKFRLTRESKLPDSPFAWTGMTLEGSPVRPFPKFIAPPYRPRDHMIGWSERLYALLKKSQLKSVRNLVNSCQHLLYWLSLQPRDIRSVDDISRDDINGRGGQSDLSFRAYLKRHPTTDESSNTVLLNVSWVFDILIEEDRLTRPNPINFRFDMFKVAVSRGKTPRTALDRDMMTFLRELNARNDFGVSRNFRPHTPQLLDTSTGHYGPVWFPGYACMIDLMLQLPLRGFQARFLDSGEGDSQVVENLAAAPSMTANPSPYAIPNRREGVFYLFDNSKGDRSVGIYVNTNKTAVDRDSGYEIPWCSEDIMQNLARMAAWQREYNPISVPIPSMERTDMEQSRNAELVESAKRVFPLFRDPTDPKGWPLSRDKLYDYWSHLLATAEDELQAGGQPVILTVEKEMSKGPNKKPVMKRQALYDIHTLRVSGITALIEAGLPPDLVQEVAGHAVLVMTLYYNKIKASKLNDRLAKAVDAMGSDLDTPDAMPLEDYDRISKFLVNRRSPEDAAGHKMLSDRIGHGAGGFEVMAHGICPGGECATGGEFTNQSVGYTSVPRPLACSLCRYRLTGPMFLPGLVLNANRLMHDLRRKAKEIGELNEHRAAMADAGKSPHVIKGRIEALYRETDIIAAEWAAEVQYVHQAEKLFEAFAADGELSSGHQAMVTGLDADALETKIDAQSEFALLQNIMEGAQVWPGYRPKVAIDDHREFLNEVLAANYLDPFLLRIKGEQRDRAATLLGRAIMAAVPSDRLDDLHQGKLSKGEFPTLEEFVDKVKREIAGVSDAGRLIEFERKIA